MGEDMMDIALRGEDARFVQELMSRVRRVYQHDTESVTGHNTLVQRT